MMSLFRSISFHNFSVSDEAIVNFLMVIDRAPVTTLIMDGVTLTGEGR